MFIHQFFCGRGVEKVFVSILNLSRSLILWSLRKTCTGVSYSSLRSGLMPSCFRVNWRFIHSWQYYNLMIWGLENKHNGNFFFPSSGGSQNTHWFSPQMLLLLLLLLLYGCCANLHSHQQDISASESHSVVSDPLWPHGLYSPWNYPAQNTGVGSCSLLQRIEPRSPALQADSLPAEPQGKPIIIIIVIVYYCIIFSNSSLHTNVRCT